MSKQNPWNISYTPETGSNDRSRFLYEQPASMRTFADIDNVKEDLDALIKMLKDLIIEAEQTTTEYALPVQQTGDMQLAEAHIKEWPDRLGSPSDYVTYSYYKALSLKNTASSSYIRRRYEEAVRDVTGTVALDIIKVADLILNETNFVREFIYAELHFLNESSKLRILEQFQNWVQSGLRYAQSLRAIYTAKHQRYIPAETLQSATQAEAKQSQAILKIQLNAYNDLFVKNLESFKRNFTEYSDVFYNKKLKPAMRYKNSAGNSMDSRKITGDSGLVIDNVMEDALFIDIMDQIKRINVFKNKLDGMLEAMEGRVKAANSIRELSVVGASLPSSGKNIVHQTKLNQEQLVYFEEEYVRESQETQPQFLAPHSSLSGRDQNDHPQYLLKDGDIISGPIELSEDGSIDGIIPSQHKHNGEDGSIKISGADLAEGSLTDSAIDFTNKPPVPNNIMVKSVEHVAYGFGTIEVEWDGYDKYIYEIQITSIEEGQ